jgi:hypothetical protein
VGLVRESAFGDWLYSATIWMERRVNLDEKRQPSEVTIDVGDAFGKRFD